MVLSSTQGVSLIGLMGAGKTTVGQMLAERLNRKFIDIDELIAIRSGRTVEEIIRDEGEERFREMEEEAVNEAIASEGSVLSCGGGVVLRPANIDRLRRHGHVAYLKVPVQVALDRMHEVSSRPLLDGDPSRQLQGILDSREGLYLEASDVVVDAAAPLDEVVVRLLAVLQ